MHYLNTRVTAMQVRPIMEQMSQVVDAMLKRLDVDLAKDEIAVAMEAFNVEAWTDRGNRDRFLRHLAFLCKVLGAEAAGPTVSKTIASMAKVLCPLKKKGVELAGALDTRVLWSWALTPLWRAQHTPKLKWCKECDLVVAWYLSLKVNTTTLERDLGTLLSKLEAHSGPLSSDGSTISAVLEVAINGPQKEEELFTPASTPGGALGLTDFSRLCAKLWICHYGRRFRYSYVKGDAKQRKKPLGQSSGTWAAAYKGRAAVTKTLVSAAKADPSATVKSFVPDLLLPLRPPSNLQGTRWAAGGSKPKDPMVNFKMQTKRKQLRNCSNFEHYVFGNRSLVICFDHFPIQWYVP